MSAPNASTSVSSATRPNGAGAAAILAAGVGAFLIAVIAILADQSAAIKRLMIFWKPTGPLSGVTTCAIVLWLAVWAILHARWRHHTVALSRVNAVAFVLLILGLLLTFPPIADLF
ncbi:MAG: hypothetical protein P4K93_16290 [Terracidiphilus sp.]|nr:hypothetical protein [Terracidiphilus sp.]MDR3799714.1 hypothetical protein [Terracidiphilus sp.]